MSMTQYNWDLEERVEDAFVAYIKELCSELALVQAAYDVSTAAFPMVVVEAHDSDNHTDTGRFTGRRKMTVTVNIITEALNRAGDTGSIEALRTAREQHRAVKSSVIGILAGNEIHKNLNDTQPENVLFSMAYMTGQSRDAGDGKIITMQDMEVIAQPNELTAE